MIRAALAILTVIISSTAALADPLNPLLPNHASQDGRCLGDNGVSDLDRSEQACLDQVGELAQRRGPRLQLNFRNGLKRTYFNEEAKCAAPNTEGCVKYRLTGYFPEHDLLLVEVGHWEDGNWLLVRADTGRTSKIVAPPHFSPSKRWLVSVASSLGPSGPPNGIDILPAAPDPSLKEWHYRVPDRDDWLYEFVNWDGDDHVNLVVTTGASATQRSASVDWRNGGWHLIKPR